MEEKNGNGLFYLASFSLVFLGFIVFVFTLMLKNKPRVAPPGQLTDQRKTATPSLAKRRGFLTLKTKDSKTSYERKDAITLTVFADSVGENISGFDLVLNYPAGIVSYSEKKNLEAGDFDLFGGAKNGKLVLTGVKKLNAQKPSVFQETPLVELMFKPVSTGKAVFTFEAVPDSKKDSNLITDTNEDVLGQTASVEIFIGESVQLLLLQPLRLNGTDMTVTLKEISIPESSCRDCMTLARLEIKQGTQTKNLEYKSGGLVGYMMQPQEAFGYRFSVEELKADGVKIIYTKSN